jgi:hypothetical protein
MIPCVEPRTRLTAHIDKIAENVPSVPLSSSPHSPSLNLKESFVVPHVEIVAG